ncbi:hypothetical protein VWS74_004032 [Salmonella enterica]|nr:hypothetical protein [Salmonella enterica]
MPNWCSNRACFYAERGQIIAIQALADGDLTPYYRRPEGRVCVVGTVV